MEAESVFHKIVRESLDASGLEDDEFHKLTPNGHMQLVNRIAQFVKGVGEFAAPFDLDKDPKLAAAMKRFGNLSAENKAKFIYVMSDKDLPDLSLTAEKYNADVTDVLNHLDEKFDAKVAEQRPIVMNEMKTQDKLKTYSHKLRPSFGEIFFSDLDGFIYDKAKAYAQKQIDTTKPEMNFTKRDIGNITELAISKMHERMLTAPMNSDLKKLEDGKDPRTAHKGLADEGKEIDKTLNAVFDESVRTISAAKKHNQPAATKAPEGREALNGSPLPGLAVLRNSSKELGA